MFCRPFFYCGLKREVRKEWPKKSGLKSGLKRVA
jgi:hypothetical protein